MNDETIVRLLRTAEQEVQVAPAPSLPDLAAHRRRRAMVLLLAGAAVLAVVGTVGTAYLSRISETRSAGQEETVDHEQNTLVCADGKSVTRSFYILPDAPAYASAKEAAYALSQTLRTAQADFVEAESRVYMRNQQGEVVAIVGVVRIERGWIAQSVEVCADSAILKDMTSG